MIISSFSFLLWKKKKLWIFLWIKMMIVLEAPLSVNFNDNNQNNSTYSDLREESSRTTRVCIKNTITITYYYRDHHLFIWRWVFFLCTCTLNGYFLPERSKVVWCVDCDLVFGCEEMWCRCEHTYTRLQRDSHRIWLLN